MEETGLYKKFLQAMKECKTFNQSGVHEYHKYRYSTIEDILSKVNESLTKYELISTIKSKLIQIKEVTTNKGTVEQFVIVETTITITDVATGQKLDIVALGNGTDTTKAQINAVKYGFILSFCSVAGSYEERR